MIGSLLGSCLRNLQGLNVAYLPDGISKTLAFELVASANMGKVQQQPYSILITPERDADGISSSEALKYRQDDRLAVVVGHHPNLGSFEHSFQEVLGLNYPEGASSLVEMAPLSQRIVDTVLFEAGVSPESHWDSNPAADVIEKCLSRAINVHRALREGTQSWNVHWIEHVDTSVQALISKLMDVASTGWNLHTFFQEYGFACFGFSSPYNKDGKFQPASTSSLVDALKTHWVDLATTENSAKYLSHRRELVDADAIELVDVDWADFDRVLSVYDNHASVFAALAKDDLNLVEALRNTPDQSFVEPVQSDEDKTRLLAFDENHQTLSIDGQDSLSGPYLLKGTFDSQSKMITSEMFHIRIPAISTIEEPMVRGSSLTVKAKTARAQWVGEVYLDVEGTLWARGVVTKPATRLQAAGKPITVKFGIDIPENDALAGLVHAKATLDVGIVVPEYSGLWTIPIKKSGAFGRPAHWSFDEESLAMRMRVVELDSDSAMYKYVVWESTSDLIPTYDGIRMESLNGRTELFVVNARPANINIINISLGSFECRAPEKSQSTHSPIIAAITNSRPTTGNLSAEGLQSIRGAYEQYVTREFDSNAFRESLGHLAAPQDRRIEIFPDSDQATAGLLLSDEFKDIWQNISDFSVPSEIIDSDQAEEFRRAFDALNLRERFSQEGNISQMIGDLLPSKVSWRSLWKEERAVLERYLVAYSELIAEARRIGSSAAVFWATYPFSISIWQTTEATTVSAVLISPLHPLRLAWIAAVESTLWDSSMAQHLAGTVEGWKFPLIGPPESEDGRLVAVPLEAGEDQIFLGWSMLVRTSIEVPRALVPPENVGRFPMPGSASSGLNGTAVSSALTSYRRMHPHISTLTIDLAAAMESPRLQEVDESILTQAHNWTVGSKQPLHGGVRVLDSTKRTGKPPRERMTRLIQATDGVPLTWSRYVPDNSKQQACNVRLLQDAGVRVKVGSKTGTSRLGIMGAAPLRRFEAVGLPNADQQSSISSPTIRDGIGWEPFNLALQECEGGAARTAIVTTKLFQSNVMNSSADWTVSGEGLMSPADIASIVSKSTSASQMLWEWRPPFLEPSAGTPSLERRPFISVARIPAGFKKQIQHLLTRALGRDATDHEVQDVLQKLGSRGVGLSSMLSMGGTHAFGALGFYLAFALMEHFQEDDPYTFVMPIDASDSFIRALSSGEKYGESLRRADLLVIRLTDNTVRLVPIEIKFYGLGAENNDGVLPTEGSSALKQALDQASNTVSILRDVATTWNRVRQDGSQGDLDLWANGLTTLVEAAARLQPDMTAEPESLANFLSQVVRGDSRVDVGKPVIAYFKHESFTTDGDTHLASQIDPPDDNQGGYGLFSANSAASFGSIQDPASALVRDWKKLLAWSLEENADEDAGMPSPPPDSSSESSVELNDDAVDVGDSSPNFSDIFPLDQHGAEETEKSPEQAGNSNAPSKGSDQAPISPPDGPQTREADLVPAVVETTSERSFDVGIRTPGVKFPVGRRTGMTSEVKADFWPSNTALNQMNVGIVGDLGTGKTQLMLSMVYQLRQSAASHQETPLSMLIFDYKKDFQDSEFLEAVGGKVLHINNIPLNFFQLRGDYTALAANQRTNEFIDVLDKIYGGIGPVQRDRLSMAVMDLYKQDKNAAPTIGRVLDKYLEGGEKPDSVTAILRKFVNAEIFSEDRAELQSFEQLMDDKVIVLALDQFGTDDDGKNSLVVLFLNLYYDYMLSSKKWPFSGNEPQLRRLNSFLLVDEAFNIMKYKFPVLMNILLQGRQFGFGVILASQYLSHFKKDQENYGEPLLTWFLHKVKTMTVRDLQAVGLADQAAALAQKAVNLGNHMSIYRSLGFNGEVIEDIPFYKLIQDTKK